MFSVLKALRMTKATCIECALGIAWSGNKREKAAERTPQNYKNFTSQPFPKPLVLQILSTSNPFHDPCLFALVSKFKEPSKRCMVLNSFWPEKNECRGRRKIPPHSRSHFFGVMPAALAQKAHSFMQKTRSRFLFALRCPKIGATFSRRKIIF